LEIARNQGFEISGSQVTCPACVKGRKERASGSVHLSPKANGKGGSVPAPSSSAVQASIAAYEMIGDYFVKDEGRYHQGWSDDVVALKSGLAKQQVIELRRAKFGDLKIDSKAQEMRLKLAASEDMARAEIAGLREMITELERTTMQKLAAMRLELDDGLGKTEREL
jgi:hypothetical protein